MLLAAEILIALLAVFGLYAILHLVLSHLLAPADTGVAIEIRHPLDEEQVAALLSGARDSFFFRGNGRVVALLDVSLRQNKPIHRQLTAAGVVCFYVDFNE